MVPKFESPRCRSLRLDMAGLIRRAAQLQMAEKKSFDKETFHLDRSLLPNRVRPDLVGCAFQFQRAYSQTWSKRCNPIGRLSTEEHRWRKGHRRGKRDCIAARD